MEETVKLIREFEERNSLSIAFVLVSDGSMALEDFWDNQQFFTATSLSEIHEFLRVGELKQSEDGRCLDPIQIIKPKK